MEKTRFVVLLTALLLILAVISFNAYQGTEYASAIILALHILLPGAAVWLLFRNYVQYARWASPIRTAWMLITAGITLSALAEMLDDVMSALVIEESASSAFAEVMLYIAGGILLACGLYIIFRELFRNDRRAYITLGILVFLGAAFFALAIAPLVQQEEGEGLLDLLQMADPFIEITATAVAISIALVLIGKPNAVPWMLIALGLVLHTSGALMYDLVLEEIAHAASPAHLVSFCGYICIAMAAYLKADGTGERQFAKKPR